jgi:hypothetical protein
MDKTEQKNQTNFMNRIAQAQSIEGKILKIGKGMQPTKTEENAYRILNGSPVYFSGVNSYNLPQLKFEIKRVKKWGHFYNPFQMMGSPMVGSDNKVYVDTRIKGWYVLWVLSKLEEWALGPMDWHASIVAWSPKSKNDSKEKAGYRMFWATAMHMENVKTDEFYNNDYFDDGGEWIKEWECSSRCFNVFSSIRRTKYKSELEFNKIMAVAPSELRTHIKSRMIIDKSFF